MVPRYSSARTSRPSLVVVDVLGLISKSECRCDGAEQHRTDYTDNFAEHHLPHDRSFVTISTSHPARTFVR